METKKLTEGGLLSALLVVLGMVMMMSGIGYWIYLDLLAPVTIALIYLRCGSQSGRMASLCTLCLTFLIQGDAVSFLYLFQACLFGLLCGRLLQQNYPLIDDLILASLLGCLMMLGMDRILVVLTGVSLLDDLSADWLCGISAQALQVSYYVAIASVPVVSMLIVYMGSLLLGKRLHLLNEEQRKKYYEIRYYPALAPWIYCSQKTVILGSIGAALSAKAAACFQKGYIKAFLVCTALILLYFILQDLIKLVAGYIFQRSGGKKSCALVAQWLLITSLCLSFKAACAFLLAAGLWVEHKTKMRQKKNRELNRYLQQHPGLSSR